MILLGLGTNQSDRFGLLQQAIELLSVAIPSNQVLVSSIYETAAWGVSDQPDYLNLALVFSGYPTNLSPFDVLDVCQRVEQQLGRDRQTETRWGARTMDVDLLGFEQQAFQTERLELPHPRLHLRRFVLEPLAEVCPDWVHPIFWKNPAALLAELKDPLSVRKFSADTT